MKIYLSKTHSDEDGPFATEGKLGIIYGTKEDILGLCDFFKQVEKNLSNNDTLHLHFRDTLSNWNKKKHIDLEVNLKN